MLSLVDPWLADHGAAAVAQEDASDVEWLGRVVRWMRGAFVLAADGEAAPGSSGGGGGSSSGDVTALVAAAFVAGRGGKRAAKRRDAAAALVRQLGPAGGGGGLAQQLLRCARAQRGTAEQLNALLVALLRALGALVRTTW